MTFVSVLMLFLVGVVVWWSDISEDNRLSLLNVLLLSLLLSLLIVLLMLLLDLLLVSLFCILLLLILLLMLSLLLVGRSKESKKSAGGMSSESNIKILVLNKS